MLAKLSEVFKTRSLDRLPDVRSGVLSCMIFLLVGWFCPAQSQINERFAPFIVDESDPSIFFLVGEIDHRTSLNFERALNEFGTPDMIVLASDGGLVNQGLVIANRIHNLQINTYIPSDQGCYSACSYLFLAGMARVADGELGVHQISSSDNDLLAGQETISDIVDILGQFNVPNDLIVNMLRTPPSDMYILSEDEKYEYGFTLRDVTARRLDGDKSLELQSRDFLIDLNRTWSRPNEQALPELSAMYSDFVNFYGKVITHEALMAEKRAFAKRWPLRNYIMDESTLSISCISQTCNATSVIQWEARSVERRAHSKGWARLSVELSFEGGRPLVISEDGEVLRRD